MRAANPMQHISDEQFTDLLAGEAPTAAALGHLESCELCRGELEAVGIAVDAFSAVGTRWAKTVAAARVGTPSRWARGLGGRVPWAAGLAVTALTGLLAFSLSLHRGAKPAAVHPVATAAPTSTDLADDNRLLLSIRQELTYRAPSAVPLADLRDRAQPHSEAIVN